MSKEGTWTIRELAKEFGITLRSIRFYEEKGLLSPQRTEGEYRLFDRRDRRRLKLILRGKRFGLSLDEIADILGVASTDMDEADQIRKALAHLEKALTDLAERKQEIEAMQRDLLQYVGGMRTRLAQLEESGRGQPY
ncbi:MAG: MerR family transcriptional regulator [Deltaproteobacteria bacterium]|nr:MerR family transcriptional regulator [Deltaproteobacteria bacterium]